jgi:hypothetical protein
MSRRQLNLSHPGVIAGVAVVLVVIVVANVRTFGSRGAGARRAEAARVQAHPSIPLDLEVVLLQAGRTSGSLGVPVSGPHPELQRDPFVEGAAAPAARVVATGPTSRSKNLPTSRPAPSRSGALACAAVMLGSGAPVALIDGRLCRVGDTVRGYRVESIDTRGVTLGGDSRLFLPVGVASSGEDANVLVTGAAPGDQKGRTSLVEYADSERK